MDTETFKANACYDVVFSEPAMLFGAKWGKTVTKARIYTFNTSGSKELCYKTRSNARRGWWLFSITNYMIEAVEVVATRNLPIEAQQAQRTELGKKLAAKVADGWWPEIVEQLNDAGKREHRDYGEGYDVWAYFPDNPALKTRNIRSIFGESVIEQIKAAVAKQEPFRFSRPASYDAKNGRDYSVNGKVQSDGAYRAWFSSEFKGCGNGSYYILINPTLAIYGEDD